MLGSELTGLYGDKIARRLCCELSPREIENSSSGTLSEYLEERAGKAHQLYQSALNCDVFSYDELNHIRLLWQQAEELAYAVLVAEETAKESVRRSTSI